MGAHKQAERTRDTLAPSGFTQQVEAVLRLVQQQVGGEVIVGLAITNVVLWVLFVASKYYLMRFSCLFQQAGPLFRLSYITEAAYSTMDGACQSHWSEVQHFAACAAYGKARHALPGKPL